MIKRLFAAFLLSLFLTLNNLSVNASEIGKIIRTAKLEKSSVASVCVRDISNSRVIYDRNPDKLMHPASSLKVFSFAASLAHLKPDYTFDTVIYADGSNNLYLKLGADPLLTSKDLKELAKELKINFPVNKVKNFYIDDTVIDKKPYPDGWLWDDFWPSIPKISPYTLNKNTVSVNLHIARNGKDITLNQLNPYKISIINELKIAPEHKIDIRKDYDETTDIINLQGTINKDVEIKIPVSNPKYYFIANFTDELEKEKINYKKHFQFAKLPTNAKLKQVAKVSHTIKEVGESVLKNSDNFSSEVVFKVAGAKYKGNDCPGTTEYGVEMFNEYYKNLGLNMEEIRLSDASGVSRYNLFTTEWMSSALVYLFSNTNIKEYMAQPGEGTLFRRLVHLKGKLWAKTGTLNGISSLTGYIKTSKGSELAFAIIISNFNKKASVVKSVEDDLMDDLYNF